jgi:hypothetical protein
VYVKASRRSVGHPMESVCTRDVRLLSSASPLGYVGCCVRTSRQGAVRPPSHRHYSYRPYVHVTSGRLLIMFILYHKGLTRVLQIGKTCCVQLSSFRASLAYRPRWQSIEHAWSGLTGSSVLSFLPTHQSALHCGPAFQCAASPAAERSTAGHLLLASALPSTNSPQRPATR